MPGQRAPGQKQVLTMFDERFLAEIDAAMRRAGYSDRSKFIRDAVYEKLKTHGVHVNYTMAMAPTRVTQRRGSMRQSMGVNEQAPKYGSKKPKAK